MAEQYDVSPERRRVLEENAKRRTFLRNIFLKQSSDPFRHASGEGGTVELHQKSYHEFEEPERLKIFEDNLKIIEKHNELYEKNQISFKLGVNQFADLTSEEFLQRFKSYPKQNSSISRQSVGSSIPDSIDWREKGAVTDVKNEGVCGAWSYSVFDPALQRYQAMRVSTYEHFKPSPKNAGYGIFFMVVPILGFAYLLHVTRASKEQKLRNGEIAYKDRDFKFI